jgi:hypothetical protein
LIQNNLLVKSLRESEIDEKMEITLTEKGEERKLARMDEL